MEKKNVRKAMALLLTMMLTLSMATAAFVSASADAFRRGDPTGDDLVDMHDVVLTQRHIASLETLNDQQLYAADVTGDTFVKMDDVMDMQMFIASLIDKFADEVVDTETDTDTATDTETDTETESDEITVGDAVVLTAETKADVNGREIDTLERYLCYEVTAIDGENATIVATYRLNGHTSLMKHTVALAGLEEVEALPAGTIETELKEGALVVLADSAEQDAEGNAICYAEALLVYTVESIGEGTVTVKADYMFRGAELASERTLKTEDVVLYTGEERPWGETEPQGDVSKGDFVYIKRAAKTYAGENIADFWFLLPFKAVSVNGDKAVVEMRIDEPFVSSLGFTPEAIAELINDNKDVVTSAPAEDVIAVLGRLGVKVKNVEKVAALQESLKSTDVTAEMVKVLMQEYSRTVRFEINTADLVLCPVA